jgi:hypothetical protein
MRELEPWPGSEGVLRAVLASLGRGRLAHAWLVVGPRGAGKAAFARNLVAAALCHRRGPGGLPCGRCDACEAVAADRHPDVWWVGSEGRLGVAEARAFGHGVALRADGSVRVLVVEACERLTGFAAAALLKVLEDPPGPRLFILLTEAPEQVEPTLRSRCQLVRLHPAPLDELAAWLVAHDPARGTAEAALQVARAAGGWPGRAWSLWTGGRDDPAAAAPGVDVAEALLAALRATTLEDALAAARRLADAGASPAQLLAVLRDLAVAHAGLLGRRVRPLGPLPPEVLADLARLWPSGALAAAFAPCQEALAALPYHVNALLNWEYVVISLQRVRVG